MRLAFCVAILLCSIRATAQPQLRPIDSHWVTIRQPVKWQSPPRELHSRIKSGRAEIMVLYPSGEFGYVACFLIRQADGTVTISRGDGFVINIGKWSRTDSTVRITSRTVYRTVVVTGRATPEPEMVEQFRAMSHEGRWSLRTTGRRFAPLPTFQDLDFLAEVIATR